MSEQTLPALRSNNDNRENRMLPIYHQGEARPYAHRSRSCFRWLSDSVMGIPIWLLLLILLLVIAYIGQCRLSCPEENSLFGCDSEMGTLTPAEALQQLSALEI
jgi:hypothetical protein